MDDHSKHIRLFTGSLIEIQRLQLDLDDAQISLNGQKQIPVRPTRRVLRGLSLPGGTSHLRGRQRESPGNPVSFQAGDGHLIF